MGQLSPCTIYHIHMCMYNTFMYVHGSDIYIYHAQEYYGLVLEELVHCAYEFMRNVVTIIAFGVLLDMLIHHFYLNGQLYFVINPPHFTSSKLPIYIHVHIHVALLSF